MKKVLLSLAATLIMVAGFASSADAQRGRGGPGVYRGGGGGFVGVRSGGGFRAAGVGVSRAGFVGGPGFRRAAFVGGPRVWSGGRWVGGPVAWGGRRWVGGPGWWGPRRFWGPGVVAAGLVGAGAFYASGCRQWQVVGTPWGPQWRLVNVCFAPVGFAPVGFYGPGVW